MISLRQLKYFVEIVDAGSYTRAAEHLFIAQSALSRQMKELETDMQVSLLQRDSRHIELTEAGQLFYERSKRILEDIENAIVQAHQVGKGEQGRIRVLHSSSVTLSAAMGDIFSRLLTQFPGVSLDFSRAPSEHQALDIDEGRADFGMVRLPILRQLPNIQVKKVFSEKLVVALSKDHRFADRGAIGIAELRDELFVSVPHKDRGGLSYLVAALCMRHDFFPKASRATSRKASLLNLIEANLGIAIVPESMQEIAPAGIRFLQLPAQDAQSNVAVIYRRDAAPMVAAFISAFLRLMPHAEQA
ncbi:LysR family transcriptional regulator [Collimonas pratensis]|uniref:Bacterial regulatory helix-turn-helix, lysR family protein n=1 Tax=Collimonas pratensis TaxID=279113 RepID=A0A127Q3G8_9BURK|nr:LysR family transcriptional regulator [Collimonas pratensis]AMP04573.1 bacterial regulatory helix-turn-helix, lysR family protein [Collimonas pratensis]